MSKILGDMDSYYSSHVYGDFLFMAPEAMLKSRVSAAMDIYSFGVIMCSIGHGGFAAGDATGRCTMAEGIQSALNGVRPVPLPDVGLSAYTVRSCTALLHPGTQKPRHSLLAHAQLLTERCLPCRSLHGPA